MQLSWVKSSTVYLFVFHDTSFCSERQQCNGLLNRIVHMSWCYHTRYKRKKGNNGKKKRHAFNRLVWKAVNLSDIFAARRYDGKRDFRWLFFSCCIEKIAFSTINYVFLLALFGASTTIFPRFRGFCHCFTGGIIVRYSSFSFFAQKALKLNQIEKQ